jgi:hypothetical protein
MFDGSLNFDLNEIGILRITKNESNGQNLTGRGCCFCLAGVFNDVHVCKEPIGGEEEACATRQNAVSAVKGCN